MLIWSTMCSIIPPLLNGIVSIQNRLLGLYYTTVHGYCEELGFPSPSPPMDSVVAAWNASYRPVRAEVESITCIARGKSIHQPLNLGETPQQRKASLPNPAPSDGYRRASSGLIPSTSNGSAPRTLRVPSQGSMRPTSPASSDLQPSPGVSPRPSFSRPDYLAPTDFTTATVLGGATVDRSPGASPSLSRSRTDYFGHQSRTLPATSPNGSSLNLNGIAKKKPPPPPPPKRIPSTRPEE